MAIYIGCDGRDCLMQIASVEQFKRSVFRAFDGAARHYSIRAISPSAESHVKADGARWGRQARVDGRSVGGFVWLVQR